MEQANISDNYNFEKLYHVGMTFLCAGSILNWLYRDYHNRYSAQYVAQTCVAAGVVCLFFTVYKWYKATVTGYPNTEPSSSRVLEITESSIMTNNPSWGSVLQKPPDYLMVEDPPPNYEDALKIENETNVSRPRNEPVPVHGSTEGKAPPPPYTLDIK